MRAIPLLFALLLAAPAARAADDLPLVVPTEGRLLDGTDQPVDGQVTMTFALYDVEVDAPSSPVPPLWSGKYTVNVSQGMYAAELGDARGTNSGPLTSALFEGHPQLWLGVTIGDGAELTPRMRLGASPYAYLAGHALLADEVADGSVTTAKLVDGAVTDAKIADVSAAKLTGQVTSDQIASLDTAKLAGEVTSDQIASLDTAKLAGEVTSDQIASLDTAKLTGQVTSDQIASLDTAKLAGEVTSGQIAGLDTAKLVGTLATTQLADGAVTDAKIAAGALTVAKLAPGSMGANAGQLMPGDWRPKASDVTGVFADSQLPGDVALTGSGALVPAQSRVSSLFVESAGWYYQAGHPFAKAVFDRTTYQTGISRGLNVLQIKRSDHSVVGGAWQGFDTCCGTDPAAESTKLATLLNGLGDDILVVVAAQDEASGGLGADAKLALKRCGAQHVDELAYRDSYLLVGVCGDPTAGVVELRRPSDDSKGGGPVATQQLVVDGSLSGALPSKAVAFSPNRRQFRLAQSGAFKKLANFDDLAFRSSGGPVEFGVTVQMNDDTGINSPEDVAQGCRLRLDDGTPDARVVDFGLQMFTGFYNFQWVYHYSTVTPLAPGMHTAYVECEVTRAAGGNMAANVGGRGLEGTSGLWVLSEPNLGANTANEDTLWAREL